jgi:signal transduction histidine kinase
LLELAAERTADLERIHALSRDRAIADERTAMARDVHDVVASHMAAIALRSGAALSTPPDSVGDRAALEAIRASALAAHADLRSMITLLRDSAPLPLEASTLADLPALLDRAGSMGVSVRLDDARDAAAPRLPARTEHAAFRITQEAVMNAVQHAQGGEVAVRIDTAHSGGIDLTVRSTRTEPQAASATSAHDGVGLLTMAERARAVGGDLRVDPTDRYWVVAAHLPAEPS